MLTELQAQLTSIDGEKTDVAAGLACAALLQQEAAGAAADAAKSGASSQLLVWAEQVCRGAAAATSPAPAATPADAEAAAEALHWARFATAAYGARQRSWQRGKTSSCAARKQLSRLVGAALAEGAQPLAGWGTAAAAADAGRRVKPSRAELEGFAAAREQLGPGSQIVSISAGQGGLLPHLVAVDRWGGAPLAALLPHTRARPTDAMHKSAVPADPGSPASLPLLPYCREKQAVVLGIAGDSAWPHAVPGEVPAPADWLASSSCAAAEEGGAAAPAAGLPSAGSTDAHGTQSSSASSWMHGDSLQAAQALLQELERSQLLQQLLRPAAGAACGTLGALDCHGWQVVVTGHGVGAGAAALLAPKLAGWHLGPVAAWAYGPPGELCSADLGAATSTCCRLTVVAVGDDAAPGTSSPAVGTLLDQAVVGLARLRCERAPACMACSG